MSNKKEKFWNILIQYKNWKSWIAIFIFLVTFISLLMIFKFTTGRTWPDALTFSSLILCLISLLVSLLLLLKFDEMSINMVNMFKINNGEKKKISEHEVEKMKLLNIKSNDKIKKRNNREKGYLYFASLLSGIVFFLILMISLPFIF